MASVTPTTLFVALALLNVLGFVLAVVDKRLSRTDASRVPESTFHILGFCGGWLGCAAGFALMHHKTRKKRFLLPFMTLSALGTGLLAFAIVSAFDLYPH